MGYDLRMHIVERSGDYVLEIASLDLCKIGEGQLAEIDANHGYRDDSVYLWGSDGNEKITEDRYGSALRIVPAETVLKAILADNKVEQYRRYEMAIALLESAIKGFNGDVEVILFGH